MGRKQKLIKVLYSEDDIKRWTDKEPFVAGDKVKIGKYVYLIIVNSSRLSQATWEYSLLHVKTCQYGVACQSIEHLLRLYLSFAGGN